MIWIVPDIPKCIKQKSPLLKFNIKYLENLSTLVIFLFFKKELKFFGTGNLRFLFLIITFLILFCLIFLSKDCLTISTSGNSGISHYIQYIFFYATISSK